MSGAGGSWDPLQYQRFRAERRQPFDDLLAMLQPAPGARVVDLGCGSGELTAELHDYLGAWQTVGVDRSAAMLEQAQRIERVGLSFVRGDIATFGDEVGASGGPGPGLDPLRRDSDSDSAADSDSASTAGGFDVIFANASLHWVPGHLEVLHRLVGMLRPCGQLAFQVPANGDHPSHALARQVAGEAPFAQALAENPGSGQDLIPDPLVYSVRLYGWGFESQRVRLQIYGHVLPSTGEVVEWVKGTLLTTYRDRLEPELYEAFVERYRARLMEVEGDQRPYFYPFKRILCWGRRP